MNFMMYFIRGGNSKYFSTERVISNELIRLSKLMSQQKICSRREADKYIAGGFVKVNGKVVTELGSKVSATSNVELSGMGKRLQRQKITVMLNKPLGIVSCQPEHGHEAAIQLLTSNNEFVEKMKGKSSSVSFSRISSFREPLSQSKLAVCGRLDADSTGILLFSQDGMLARKLISDDTSVEKEYLVRVNRKLDPLKDETMLNVLRYDLSLDNKKLKHAVVDIINEDQLRFVLNEGKKRQIRRMCELVGLKVLALKRVRIGKLVLGRLPLGKWRYVKVDDIF